MTHPINRYLREDEVALLIRESMGKPTPFAAEFGPGFVRLGVNDAGEIESAWAIPILEKARGITAEEGAGI